MSGILKKKQRLTYSQMIKKNQDNINNGKTIHNLHKDYFESAQLEAEANKNADSLKSFIDKFGEEVGTEMYQKNVELKGKMNN